MIFKSEINSFDYSNVTTITKDVVEQMYNAQKNKMGELFELENALLDKELSQEDTKLILEFYCETPITTAEEFRKYPILKKQMWDTYKSDKKLYKKLKKEFESLDLKLCHFGRQSALEAIVAKKSITRFRNIYENAPEYLFIEDALNEIKSDNNRKIIESIRNAETKDEKDKLKRNLPVLLFNGLFYKRNSKAFIKFNEYLALDFDGFHNENEVLEAKDKLSSDPYVFSVFTSPKGRGLKVIIKVKRESFNDHLELFNGAEKYFSFINGFDIACKDISRACYLSHDPDIYINTEAQIFNERVKTHTNKSKKNKMRTIDKRVREIEKEVAKGESSIFNITDREIIIELITKYWEKKYGLKEGERNNNLFKLAIKLYSAGVPEVDISKMFHERFKGVFESDDELDSIISSSCKDESKFGSQPWVDYDFKSSIISNLDNPEKLEELLAQKGRKFDESSVEEELRKLRMDNFKFWDKVTDSQGDLKGYRINEARVIRFCEMQDILSVKEENGFKYYQKIKNVLHDIDIYDIKKIMINYIKEKNGVNENLINVFLKSKDIYKDLFLSELQVNKLDRIRDTKNKCYKFFKNGVLIIHKDKKNELVQYEDLALPVHSNQIIQKNFSELTDLKSDFEVFIEDISGENFESFCSAIGYLCTNYKSQSKAKAVVLNDSNTSFESASGGRGKSLISKAISKFSTLKRIDGKQYRVEDNFSLASVEETDDVVFIDDVKQGFHFTNFYNLITDDFEITKKYSNKKSISFEKAPKLLLSSNYPIKGTDHSSIRRRFDLVLTNYYSVNRTPVQKFGKEFFTSWGDAEWNSFYHFMIRCVKLYLEKGLIPITTTNMGLKELIGDTSEDFLSFMEENKVLLQEDYLSLEIVKLDYFKFSNQNISARKLKSWLSKWCKYYGYNLVDSRRNNKRVYKLKIVTLPLEIPNMKVA